MGERIRMGVTAQSGAHHHPKNMIAVKGDGATPIGQTRRVETAIGPSSCTH